MPKMPCDADGRMSRDRLAGCYPTLYVDGKRWQSYRRLCLDHMSELLGSHRRDWTDSAFDGSLEQEPACTGCGVVVQEIAALHPFYCTAYPDGKERRDFRAFYCVDCAELIKRELHLNVKPS